MNHTVIGIFDNKQEADKAVEHLVSLGISQAKIDACSANATNMLTSTGESHSRDNDRYNQFFGSLLDKDDDVRNYSEVAGRGCTVTVHASSEEEAHMAAQALDQFGAVDVDERVKQYRPGNYTQNPGAAMGETTNAVPVIEEELHVGKRVVQTGGVRLRSRIIARPVEEHLRLREEHVSVERHPVDRAVSPADIDSFREETIEVREKAEVPSVNKNVRVVEEVRLNKEVEEHDEVIRDSVRHTEVEVENFEGNSHMDTDTVRNNLQGSSTADMDADADYLDKSHQNWSTALHRLREVEDDYKVASDDPDVRGWDVIDSTENKMGVVEELIVDTNAMKVRYLEVKVNTELLNTAVGNDHHILIPIGNATLDHSHRTVLVSTLNRSSLANYPAYTGESITRDYEHGLLSALSPDDYHKDSLTNDRFYEGKHFDSSRFYGSQNL